jgi:hypothetical protein
MGNLTPFISRKEKGTWMETRDTAEQRSNKSGGPIGR